LWRQFWCALLSKRKHAGDPDFLLPFITPHSPPCPGGLVSSAFVEGETENLNNHVEAGAVGGRPVLAPASAHTVAKLANGLSDVSLTAISARCPVFPAPPWT